jgi:hypothetical protein
MASVPIPSQRLRLSATALFFPPQNLMAFATLLPQIRTDEPLIKRTGHAGGTVGLSTTMIVLANRARTIHSQLGLPKQSAFAQNAPEPKIEAMDT